MSEDDYAAWTKRVSPLPGDTLFSYETRIGQVGYWDFEDPAALGRRMGLLRPAAEVIDPKYLTLSYLGSQFQDVISENTVRGGTVERISIADMPDWPLVVPELAEQCRISKFFRTLDDLIAINQRKVEELKRLKQAYLQQLFPAPDQVAPRLRFLDFDHPWTQCKLGDSDIAQFINGRAFSQDELLESGKYPILRVGNFYTNDSWYFSDLELPEKNYANNGDLLYTWAASFGPHIWHGGKVIFHYHIWKVLLGPLLSRNFALQVLINDRDDLLRRTHGSTMIHVTKADMESKEVALPSVPEQNQIGEFFQVLDDLIAVNQQKTVLLERIKQGYLQQMFI